MSADQQSTGSNVTNSDPRLGRCMTMSESSGNREVLTNGCDR